MYMATKAQEAQQILDYWNSKKIIVHRRINQDLNNAISRTLKFYPVNEVIELIDFYATILEPGVSERSQKYFWTHKWSLYEFLMRGVRKFDGRELTDFLKKHTVENTEAVVFKRDNN